MLTKDTKINWQSISVKDDEPFKREICILNFDTKK